MKIVTELIRIFLAFIPVVAGLEGGTVAEEKRAAAIAEIKAILLDPTQPLNWPPFLKGYEDLFLGLMVTGAVKLAKATGFFVSAKTSSGSSVPPLTPPG